LLKILNQSDKFASLNWFESMLGKLKNDLANTEQKENLYADEMGDLAYEDQKLDSEMSRRRIHRHSKEFEMLKFCFSAS